MKQLSRALLRSGFNVPAGLETGPLEIFPEKIIQFGEGNFLRAFADWMVDRLNAEAGFAGSVVVVQPIRNGTARLLNRQDGLYTLFLRGISGGRTVETRRIVTAVSRALNPYEQWAEVVEAFCGPQVRFLFSNTTEAGIAYAEEPFVEGGTPAAFPAKVTALLYERFKRFSGDAAKGLVIIPCELIDRNGDNLKRIVLRYAREWGLSDEFMRWVETANFFLNTLVDRIVPGYPAGEAGELTESLGYEDKLLDAAETFHLWVLEGPERLAEEFPLHKLGLNVVWTDNMAPYRTRKVRILNGAHTAGVPAAFLGGLDTVREMVEDEVFGVYLRKAVFEEIVPTMDMSREELVGFAENVMERFANPFIRHELLSISLNSVSKWKVRVLPSLLDYEKRYGSLPPALSFSFAALIAFYRGNPAAERELTGRRGENPYPVRDDADVLSFLTERWQAFEDDGDLNALVSSVAAEKRLWGENLTVLPGFVELTAGYLGKILEQGMREAVKILFAGS